MIRAQGDGPRAVAKVVPQVVAQPPGGAGNESEPSNDSDDDSTKTCYFEDCEGFKCGMPDDLAMCRMCIGVTRAGTEGTQQESACKKNGGKPCYFHHTCFINFYTVHKKKILKDEESCLFCPACKAPKFDRKKRD